MDYLLTPDLQAQPPLQSILCYEMLMVNQGPYDPAFLLEMTRWLCLEVVIHVCRPQIGSCWSEPERS